MKNYILGVHVVFIFKIFLWRSSEAYDHDCHEEGILGSLLATTTETATKTSLENKHLRSGDYLRSLLFAHILYC